MRRRSFRPTAFALESRALLSGDVLAPPEVVGPPAPTPDPVLLPGGGGDFFGQDYFAEPVADTPMDVIVIDWGSGQ